LTSSMADDYDLIKIIARSQCDYPDGIGEQRSISNIRSVVGRKYLWKCSRSELNKIIEMSRDEYIYLKQKGHNN
jgi:hypothetical protein